MWLTNAKVLKFARHKKTIKTKQVRRNFFQWKKVTKFVWKNLGSSTKGRIQQIFQLRNFFKDKII